MSAATGVAVELNRAPTPPPPATWRQFFFTQRRVSEAGLRGCALEGWIATKELTQPLLCAEREPQSNKKVLFDLPSRHNISKKEPSLQHTGTLISCLIKFSHHLAESNKHRSKKRQALGKGWLFCHARLVQGFSISEPEGAGFTMVQSGAPRSPARQSPELALALPVELAFGAMECDEAPRESSEAWRGCV